jgi:starvation-inducible DNA-binding protein
MMRLTHNMLSENVCAQTGELLNRPLAAAFGPHGQLKQAHYNVEGPTFIAVPALFDMVSREAEGDSDLIAERNAGLGAVAEGQSNSRPIELLLSPIPFGSPTTANAATLVAFGQSACEAVGQSAAIGDADTADFFTEMWPGADDRLWFVESHAARI